MPEKKTAPKQMHKAQPKPVARRKSGQTLSAPPIPPDHFPVVGLGASAGGLEALKAFFAQVPEDSGLAYIVNVHMTPKQPSLMLELLQRIAKVKVSSAEEGQVLAPNHIYVVPSDKIKANDGLVLVQSEASAAYDGRPRSAIGTGVVEGVDLFRLHNGFLARTGLRARLKQAAETDESFQIDVGQSAPATTLGAYCLKGRSLPPTDGEEPGHILLQFAKEC